MVSDISELQQEIRLWADEHIPDRTADHAIKKLVDEEIPELLASGTMGPLEFADVVILILDIAWLRGIDIQTAVKRKMEINRRRRWAVGPDGVLKHVK